MKTKSRIILFLSLALPLLSFTGCSKDKETTATSNATAVAVKTKERVPVSMTMNNDRVSFESMTSFFKPDYTRELPDQDEETQSLVIKADKNNKK